MCGGCLAHTEPVKVEEKDLNIQRLLTAAYHALRSYQYRNQSSELAEEVADQIEKVIDLPLSKRRKVEHV